MAFIRRVKTASGATAIQVAHKVYGKIVRIDHIGSAHNQTDLAVLLSLARQRLQGQQVSLFDQPEQLTIGLAESTSTVLRDLLLEQYAQLGFGQLNDTDFVYLCLARLVEPTSKLDSLRVLDELGITTVVGEDQLYRCLRRVITRDYRSQLAKLCFAHASQGSGIALVLYDVTTLYFETKERDEDTYRKPGMSKERRLDPQIVVGLLVDQTGFPLELHSFEGNKAETKTIIPVIEQFKQRHGLVDLTVVADAGMLSQTNLEELAKAGYTYIVGSRIYKVPYDVAECRKTNKTSATNNELQDGQIIASTTATAGQRIIYQYRAKRAARDLKNIEKQIARANKIIEGKAVAKKAKFMTVTTEGKQTTQLNQALIDKAKALAGIKGYVTNLPPTTTSSRQIIAFYHQLWQVEQSFRMSKSDLKARPIFHHTKDAIEAHLTLVMAALAIGQMIERKTGKSLKYVVKALRPIRSGIVIIGGKRYTAQPIIPPGVAPMVKRLVGH